MRHKQNGQTMIEFALVLPFFIFMFLSVLYIGIMFLDYTQYSNAARDAARDISTQSGSRNTDGTVKDTPLKQRLAIVDKLTKKNDGSKYASPLTSLYSAKWTAVLTDKNGNTTRTDSGTTAAVDVKVTIELKRDDLPEALENWEILPHELKAIEYKMKLEEPTVIVIK